MNVIFQGVAIAYDIESCQKDFCQAMLDQHNMYRQLHQVNDLTLADEISEISQNYAALLADENGGLHHSDTEYGENLAYQMNSRFRLNEETCKGSTMTKIFSR